MSSSISESRIGLIQAMGACFCWGLIPVYFKLLQQVAAVEVVAHRILWSVPLLLAILYIRKNLGGLRASIADSKVRMALLASSVLIALNWLGYVWAVHENHILAASLGYFISPLLNVFLASIFLKEKLSRNQWIAIAIAALGVSILAVQAWETLWISLLLAGSWSSYAIVRKVVVVGPVVGLTIETGLLFPVFLAFLLWASSSGLDTGGTIHMGDNLGISLLLIGGAVVTAVPLMLFAAAVKKMTLSAIGLLLYVAPTIQFLIATFIYKEVLTPSHIICFILIWTSLAIFSTDSIIAERRRRSAVPMQT